MTGRLWCLVWRWDAVGVSELRSDTVKFDRSHSGCLWRVRLKGSRSEVKLGGFAVSHASDDGDLNLGDNKR